MRFETPNAVEQAIWTMRQASWPRGQNRSLIDRVADGYPPLTAEQEEELHDDVNVNWLEMTKLLADGRRSYYTALMQPSNFFTVTLDWPADPVKGTTYGGIITRELNSVLRSLEYVEEMMSQFASVVCHGIGPIMWPNMEALFPHARAISDVLIPSNTLRSMRNLSHFAVFHQETPMQLWRKTHAQHVDPGWNMKVVDAAIEWALKESSSNLNYNDYLEPEKQLERFHADMGLYGTDAVPTIDYWDFWYWSSEGGKEGWRRKSVIDTPMQVASGGLVKAPLPKENGIGMEHKAWLYDGGERVYADHWNQIIQWQFADLSSTAPFMYHSVRSLGWLLYAPVHIENRLLNRLVRHIMENMQQYFRISGQSDHERLNALVLADRAEIPEGVQFVPQTDRWQINQGLVAAGLDKMTQKMQSAAAQYREGRDLTGDRREKTATQVMQEVNAANALVGSMLLLAYRYEREKYQEMCRRACIPNSSDKRVREFRVKVLKAGVPEDALNHNLWRVEPEKVLGSGNKVLQIAMADKLMAVIDRHSPEAQQEILHLYDVANSDNPALADRLVPREANVSATRHDAELALGAILAGQQVTPSKHENTTECVETWLAALAKLIKDFPARGTPTPSDLLAVQNLSIHIHQRIQTLASNEEIRQRTKQYEKDLAMLDKAFGQVLKSMPQQQQQKPGIDPKDAAKVQGMQMQAQAKADIARRSADQRTAQRQEQHRFKMKQEREKHQLEMVTKAQTVQLDAASKDMVTAAEIRRGGMKSKQTE